MALADVWLAIERTCHEVTIRRVGGTYRGEPHEQDVQAVCRCGWRGPSRPAVKAETWAARDGREHLVEVETRTPPSGWPDEILLIHETARQS